MHSILKLLQMDSSITGQNVELMKMPNQEPGKLTNGLSSTAMNQYSI